MRARRRKRRGIRSEEFWGDTDEDLENRFLSFHKSIHWFPKILQHYIYMSEMEGHRSLPFGTLGILKQTNSLCPNYGKIREIYFFSNHEHGNWPINNNVNFPHFPNEGSFPRIRWFLVLKHSHHIFSLQHRRDGETLFRTISPTIKVSFLHAVITPRFNIEYNLDVDEKWSSLFRWPRMRYWT